MSKGVFHIDVRNMDILKYTYTSRYGCAERIDVTILYIEACIGLPKTAAFLYNLSGRERYEESVSESVWTFFKNF